MHFVYCPVCGSKLAGRVLGDEGMVPWCESCNRPWFDMFSSCVIVLAVAPDGNVALLKPADRDYQYKTLVSGYMKPGECAEECARREVEEEIGVRLGKLRLMETVWFPRGEMLMIAFIGYAENSQMTLSVEVEEAGWFTAEEAITLVHPKGPGNASHLLVERYLNEIRAGKA